MRLVTVRRIVYDAGMALDTLALTSDWDLDIDDQGNWRTVGDATQRSPQTGAGMRLAQDVATRLRAWRGEVWYDATQGIDYPRYLGRAPALLQLRMDYQSEALRVPLCATALASLDLDRPGRTVGGTVYLSDLNGYTAELAV
ncbi:hypothetical protein [Xanthomonas phage XPV2]|nr:hypothetical protein [Xanthomonas phage XPV2]